MKYVSLVLLLTCAAFMHAMDDDNVQEVLSEPEIIKYELGYAARSVAFSPTDDRFLAACNATVCTYEGDSDQAVKVRACGENTHEVKGYGGGNIHDLFFSPSGDKIVTRLSNGAVRMQDSDGPSFCGFWPAPFLFKFNSKGDYIRQTDNTTVEIAYTVKKLPGRLISILQDEVGEISSASIDDNGHIAIASKGKVQVWGYDPTQLIKELKYEKNNITFVRLNAAGDRVFIGSWLDDEFHSARGEVWNMQEDQSLCYLPNADSAQFVDNKLLVKSRVHHVVIYDASTGDRLKNVPSDRWREVHSCEFSPDNRYFAQSDTENVSLYDADGNLLSQIKHDGDVAVEAVSPRGDTLAVKAGGKTSIWRLAHLMKKRAKV